MSLPFDEKDVQIQYSMGQAVTLNACARFWWINQSEKSFYALLLYDVASSFTHLGDWDESCERIFFFSSLKYCLSSSEGLACCQHWDTWHCLIRRSQTLRSGDRPKKTPSWCLFRVSHIGAWLVQVAGGGGCQRLCCVREVECVQVERLITQHLKPFFTSPFTTQPVTFGVPANQKWAGSSEAMVEAAAPVMAAHLAGSTCPAVCLFWLFGRPLPSPCSFTATHSSQKKVEDKCVL